MDDYYNAKTRWLPHVFAICGVTILFSFLNCAYAYKVLKSPSRDSRRVQQIVLAANVCWLFGNIMNAVFVAYLNPLSEWSCCDNMGVLISGFPSQWGASTGSFLFMLMIIHRLNAMRVVRPFSKHIILVLLFIAILVYLGVLIGPMTFIQCYFSGDVASCTEFSMLFDTITKLAAIVMFGLYLIVFSIVFIVITLMYRVKVMALLASDSASKQGGRVPFNKLRIQLVSFLVGVSVLFLLIVFFSLGLFIETPLIFMQLLFSLFQTFQFSLGFLLDDKLNWTAYRCVPQRDMSHEDVTTGNTETSSCRSSIQTVG